MQDMDIDRPGGSTDNFLRPVREGGREYIVSEMKSEDTFTGKMIIKNDIGSLLAATSREFNGDAYIYYDVSGRVRFCDMFSGEKDIMEHEDVERLCRSFERLAGDVREYLLDIGEICVSPETLFFNPEKKEYEFLYIPAGDDSFNEGVRMVWERVMEKFNHHSDIGSIARVYDIYQKVSMQSFDPEEVFAQVKKTEINEAKQSVFEKVEDADKTDGVAFSKVHLKETIEGGSISEDRRVSDFSLFPDEADRGESGDSEGKANGSIFDGLKMKLAGSAGLFSGKKTTGQGDTDEASLSKKGYFSGVKTGRESRIDEISKSMDEEAKTGYKIKEYLAVNSGNIFKVLMCVAALFIVLALMPASVTFRPPVPACVGIFLMCVAVAVYARKLGKEHTEDQAKGEI